MGLDAELIPSPACECGCHIETPFSSDSNKRPEGFVCTECPCLANQIIDEWLGLDAE